MKASPRKAYVVHLQANERLARDVINSDTGHLILAAGTQLTPSQIVRLKQLNVREVWIEGAEIPQAPSPAPQQQAQNLTMTPQVVEEFNVAVDVVRELFSRVSSGQTIETAHIAQQMVSLNRIAQNETNVLNLFVNLRVCDDYTFEHSIGVGLLASKLGHWLGLSDQECQDLLLAGALHDIGKCKVDISVLNKPGRLTPEEYDHIKKHTTAGYAILCEAGVPEAIALGALNHHEKMDGRGYPRGLQEPEIDLYSRILAVADIFNAMTSRRVYHAAISYYKVLDELTLHSFGQLDPKIVSVFVQKMTDFLVGNQVVLSNGTEGTVVLVPADRPTRPLVNTEHGFIDLLRRSDLHIEHVKAI